MSQQGAALPVFVDATGRRARLVQWLARGFCAAVVIVAGALRWIWQPPGNAAIALDIVFKGGLIVWALDEIFRGVNPWRRCLGGAVLAYELTTFL